VQFGAIRRRTCAKSTLQAFFAGIFIIVKTRVVHSAQIGKSSLLALLAQTYRGSALASAPRTKFLLSNELLTLCSGGTGFIMVLLSRNQSAATN